MVFLKIVLKHRTSIIRWLIVERASYWAASSEFVSSSIPSWQILTAHARPFRGARDLPFCLKVPLDSLLVWASSGGSGETARMRRLAWIFAARIGDKNQIRLTRPNCHCKRIFPVRLGVPSVFRCTYNADALNRNVLQPYTKQPCWTLKFTLRIFHSLWIIRTNTSHFGMCEIIRTTNFEILRVIISKHQN